VINLSVFEDSHGVMIKRIRELSKNEFVRNVFTLMSATTVAQAIAILIYLVLAKIYSTSEHGIFALYMSIIAVTGIISTGKYESAVMMPGEEGKAFNLVALSSFLCTVFSLFLLFLVILFHKSLAILLGDPMIEKWLWFVPLSTFMIGHFQSLSYWSNRYKRYGSMAVANVGQSLANSAIKVSTSKVFLNGGGLIVGAIIGQFIGIMLFVRDFIRKDIGFFHKLSFSGMKEIASEYRLFPRFNMIHNLINNFSSSLPIFVITSKFGAAEAGLYSFGFLMIFRPVNLATSSFTQVFSQRIISHYNKGKKIFPDVRRLVIKLVQFGIGPFIIAGFAGPWIFTTFFGEGWTEAGKYMQVLLPWIFTVLVSSPLSFLPDMLKRQKTAMWLDVLKIAVRIPALAIGVYYNNIYLAIVLFSAVSTLSVGYSLYWYLYLARRADVVRGAGYSQSIELPINIDVKEM
jgi:O-antigen/teichoic acid export membrane protein